MSGRSKRPFRAIEPRSALRRRHDGGAVRRRPAMPPALIFFLSLLIGGALAGAIYALIALAFVLVYKSSRMVNVALGEGIMLGATLTAVGQAAIGMGLAAAIVFAAAG